MATLPTMLEHDRKQAGWSVGQAAWRLGVSIRTQATLRRETYPPFVAAFPGMLEHDRKRAGWSVGQMAWRLGVAGS